MDITKISQKIWEIVGLAFGVFFLLGTLAFAVAIGFGLFQYKTHHVAGIRVTPKEDKGKLKTTVEYGLPLTVKGTNFYIVPAKLEKREQGEERDTANEKIAYNSRYESYPSSSDGIFSYRGPYYNLVFMNKKTGESRALLDQKGFISGVYFPERSYTVNDDEIKPTFLLLKIAVADTNSDDVINEKDASAAFIANIDGTGLTQVTPDNTQMRWWHYDSETQNLFIEIVSDIDNDHKFNWDDPKTVVRVNALAPKMGEEFLSENVKNTVESILIGK